MDNDTIFEGAINANSEVEIQEYLRHYFLLKVFTPVSSISKIPKKPYQMFFDSGYREYMIYLSGSYTLYGWYSQINTALVYEKGRVLKEFGRRFGNLAYNKYQLWDAVDIAFGSKQYYRMQELNENQKKKLVVFFKYLQVEVEKLIMNWVPMKE